MVTAQPSNNHYPDLLIQIENGTIKIPQFQRDFVWNKAKSTALLEGVNACPAVTTSSARYAGALSRMQRRGVCRKYTQSAAHGCTGPQECGLGGLQASTKHRTGSPAKRVEKMTNEEAH